MASLDTGFNPEVVNSQKDQVLVAALRYANMGLPVFPIRENDKRPNTKHGFYNATKDPQQLTDWFAPGTHILNMAACPDDFGCFVVDVDGKEGAASWSDIQVRHLFFRPGLAIQTPSGGWHYWFRGQLPSSVRKVAPGIDVRGIGGYVLLPPSMIDSREYKIISGSFDTITEAPPEFYEWLQAKYERDFEAFEKRDTSLPLNADHALASAHQYITRLIKRGIVPEDGNRNAHATQVYIKLHRLGVDPDSARVLYERFYTEANGARPDVEPCPKIENLIDRIWNGKGKELFGSECPPTASEMFGDPSDVLARINSPIKLRNGATVKKRKVEWYWKGWLAKGKIHLLAGEPGTGKSTLALKLLATVSRGALWPDNTQAPRGRILIWSGEDSIEDTLLPRFEAMGGDLSMVEFIDRVEDPGGGERLFHPGLDMSRLISTAKLYPDLKVILVDPISISVLGDSHNNTEVRQALLPLYDFCEQTGIAVLGITHFSKNTDGKTIINRVTGSLGFGAVARIVLAAAKSADGTIRRLVRGKSNIGPDRDGIDFALGRNAEEEQFVTWGAYKEGSGEDLLAELLPEKGKPGRPDIEKRDATLWLRELVLSARPKGIRVREAIRKGDASGFSAATLKRARRDIPQIRTDTRLGRAAGGEEWYVWQPRDIGG